MDHELENNATQRGHETSDASVKSIIFSGIGLALATVAVCFLMLFIFRALSRFDTPASVQQSRQAVVPQQPAMVPPAVPGPHLQDDPAIEIERLHARERTVLGTYGWVDKKNGVVRIPIDRAMDKLLEQGLPVRKQDATK